MGTTNAGSSSRVRHPHDQVGVHRVFLSQLLSHCQTGRIKEPTVNHAVGAGKVNIFKDAQRFSPHLFLIAINPIVSDSDYLAGFNLSGKAGANVVKSTALRGYNPAAINGPQTQRAHPKGVANPK